MRGNRPLASVEAENAKIREAQAIHEKLKASGMAGSDTQIRIAKISPTGKREFLGGSKSGDEAEAFFNDPQKFILQYCPEGGDFEITLSNPGLDKIGEPPEVRRTFSIIGFEQRDRNLRPPSEGGATAALVQSLAPQQVFADTLEATSKLYGGAITQLIDQNKQLIEALKEQGGDTKEIERLEKQQQQFLDLQRAGFEQAERIRAEGDAKLTAAMERIQGHALAGPPPKTLIETITEIATVLAAAQPVIETFMKPFASARDAASTEAKEIRELLRKSEADKAALQLELVKAMGTAQTQMLQNQITSMREEMKDMMDDLKDAANRPQGGGMLDKIVEGLTSAISPIAEAVGENIKAGRAPFPQFGGSGAGAPMLAGPNGGTPTPPLQTPLNILIQRDPEVRMLADDAIKYFGGNLDAMADAWISQQYELPSKKHYEVLLRHVPKLSQFDFGVNEPEAAGAGSSPPPSGPFSPIPGAPSYGPAGLGGEDS